MKRLRTFSFGGGVQSTAALVLAAQGKIDYQTFLFAHVGEDSESPDTLSYIEEVSKPYAKKHGIELLTLRRIPVKGRYKGQVETVYGRVMGDNRSICIPARMSNGAPGNRACTADFKIRVIAKWQKQAGATAGEPAITGLGISVDEIQRMNVSKIAHQELAYPLIDLGLSRKDCRDIIEGAGLPVAPKSACWFCPMQSRAQWTTLRREKPELFFRAVEMEVRINEKRGAMGKDIIRLHRSLSPLDQAVGLQYTLFDDDEMDVCDSGFCFT